MIKQLWTVRSHKKLFTGLAFAIAGFITFYTVLTLLVLEPSIPWNSFSGPATVSKFWLLLYPVVSLGCCVLLYFDSKRQRLPFHPKAPRLSPRQQSAYADFSIGENFLLALLFFFLQLDKLNTAKSIPGFAPLIPFLVAAAIIGYAAYAIRKIILAGKGETL